MAMYVTHTGLQLETYRENGEYVCRLMAVNEPTRAKILYRGLDQEEQQRAYQQIKKHYDQRRKDEVSG